MDEKMRNEIALFRYGLIAEVVSRELQKGEQAQRFRDIASKKHVTPYGEKQTVSKRTLERYLHLYRNGGFEALKPTPDQLRIYSLEMIYSLFYLLFVLLPNKTPVVSQ